MGLPLYLAVTPGEIQEIPVFPEHFAWMGCEFSPFSTGISNIPNTLPPDSMVILTDRLPCTGHSPGVVADQLEEAVQCLHCSRVLLDFQRPPDPESRAMVRTILDTLPCPVGVPPAYEADGPVLLPPCPLNQPLEEFLHPWNKREIWMEAGLCQQIYTVSSAGSAHSSQIPPLPLDGGQYDPDLCCQYHTRIFPDRIEFILSDTLNTLPLKLEKAGKLGVALAVGMARELKIRPR